MKMKRLIIVCTLYSVLCTPLWAQTRQKTTRADECISIFTDVMRQVDVNYVDTLNYEDLTETAINAMLRKIDPYTVYYSKKHDRDLRMMTTGKYGGIGSIIQQRPRPEKTDKKQSKPTAKQKIEKSDLIEPNQIHKRTKKLLHHFWQTSQRIP